MKKSDSGESQKRYFVTKYFGIAANLTTILYLVILEFEKVQ